MKISERYELGAFFERDFYCPGCNCYHGFRSADWPEPEGLDDYKKKLFANKWVWNGDSEKPTLSPSIHVQKEIGRDAENKPIYETICHSFVENGSIRFLDDCKHELRGRIIEMSDV